MWVRMKDCIAVRRAMILVRRDLLKVAGRTRVRLYRKITSRRLRMVEEMACGRESLSRVRDHIMLSSQTRISTKHSNTIIKVLFDETLSSRLGHWAVLLVPSLKPAVPSIETIFARSLANRNTF